MRYLHRFPLRPLTAVFFFMGLAVPLPALAVNLPAKAPIPKEQPGKADTAQSGTTDDGQKTQPEVAPLPTPRPDVEDTKRKEPEKAGKDAGESGGKNGDGKADSSPETPKTTEKGETGDESDGESAHETEPAKPPEDFAPLSEKGKQCRADLTTMGVAFTERDPVSTDEGCLIPHPIVITALAEGVAIEPEAELNCSMAEATARFVEEVVQPAAYRHFGQGVKAVRHASAYVCRPRAGTHIMSEHAFGNALDIAAFVLEDGTSVGVRAYDASDQKQVDKSAFMDEIRAAACGPFTTVLGPGSNAAHATHFHLDIKKRGGGYKVCE